MKETAFGKYVRRGLRRAASRGTRQLVSELRVTSHAYYPTRRNENAGQSATGALVLSSTSQR
jgi:hypothetical protein